MAQGTKHRVQIFSTDDVPAPQRVQAWREHVKDTYSELGLEIDNPRQFRARLCRLRLGALVMSWMETAATKARVKGATVGRWSAPLSDAFLLSMQLAGEVSGEHFGEAITSRQGDMILIDATRPWTLTTAGQISNITIKIPSDRLLGIVEKPERYCAKPFPSDDPVTHAVSNVIVAMRDAFDSAPEAEWDSAFGDVLMSAIARLFPEDGGASEATVRDESLRRKAIAFIENHLGDPELTSGAVATKLGVSARTVQRLFSQQGSTPGQYIIDRRIAKAGEKLRSDPEARITDLAYALGFNDLSHFTRIFRKKFGQSPTRFRDQRGR